MRIYWGFFQRKLGKYSFQEAISGQSSRLAPELSVYKIFLTVNIYIGWLALYDKSSFHVLSDLLIYKKGSVVDLGTWLGDIEFSLNVNRFEGLISW